jgi:NADH dehydrogenase
VLAALPDGARGEEAAGRRYELAGPETLSYAEVIAFVLQSLRRHRPIVHIPMQLVRRLLNAVELLAGPTAFATWDEAALLEIPLVARQGTADAERLGVLPKPMRAVLGVG